MSEHNACSKSGEAILGALGKALGLKSELFCAEEASGCRAKLFDESSCLALSVRWRRLWSCESFCQDRPS